VAAKPRKRKNQANPCCPDWVKIRGQRKYSDLLPERGKERETKRIVFGGEKNSVCDDERGTKKSALPSKKIKEKRQGD